jgi:hypothetical protein
VGGRVGLVACSRQGGRQVLQCSPAEGEGGHQLSAAASQCEVVAQHKAAAGSWRGIADVLLHSSCPGWPQGCAHIGRKAANYPADTQVCAVVKVACRYFAGCTALVVKSLLMGHEGAGLCTRTCHVGMWCGERRSNCDAGVVAGQCVVPPPVL